MRVVHDHVAAVVAAAVAVRHRRQASADDVRHRVHLLLEARRQMSVALELSLEAGRQTFAAPMMLVLVAIVIAAMMVTILAIMTALIVVLCFA